MAVFIIILNHYSKYAGFTYDSLCVNSFIMQFLHIGGKIGVNIFIFITGWYTSQAKTFNLKRMVKLVLRVFFYSVPLAVIGIVFKTLSTKEILKMLVAIPYGNWIFITSYFILMCISPYINKLLNAITYSEHVTLVLFCGVIWCIFPTFILADFDVNNTLWYIFVYIFAALIRRSGKSTLITAKRSFLYGGIAIALIMISEVVLDYIAVWIPKLSNINTEHFRNMNSILNLTAISFLFLGFLNLKPRQNKMIEKIASTSLAVFMLHDNYAVRTLIWEKIFHISYFQYSFWLPVHAFVTVTVIFAFGCIVDIFRQWIFDNVIDKQIEQLVKHLQNNHGKLLCLLTKQPEE